MIHFNKGHFTPFIYASYESLKVKTYIRVLSCLEKCVEFWVLKNLQNPCQIFNRTSALKNKSHFSETQDLFIVSQATRKTKPEIKQELQDWNYNFFEDFAMLGAPEKVAYNFKTLVITKHIRKLSMSKNWLFLSRIPQLIHDILMTLVQSCIEFQHGYTL